MPESQSRADMLLRGLPFLIMAAVAISYVIAGPGLGITPLLSLGPAFATLTGGVRHTLTLAAVAFVLSVLLLDVEGELGTSRALAAFLTLSGVTIAALVATTQRMRRVRELTEMHAIADVAQRVLLRPVPRQAGQLRLAVRYISASAGAQIGGDLYEVALAGDRVRLVVGDVQGKGLAAAQTAAATLGAFREAAYGAPSLFAIADRMEASLLRILSGEQFVTAVIAEVALDGSRMEVLNCGHPPPLLLSGTGAQFAEWPATGLPLGMTNLGARQRQAATIALAPGDGVLFYTDGISEARSRDGSFYPLATRLPPGPPGHCDPGAALDHLRGDLLRYVGHPLDDDAAMLMIARLP